MRATLLATAVLLVTVGSLPPTVGAEAEPLPSENGRSIVARVNGEPILLEDLLAIVAETHGEEPGAGEARRHADPGETLERMIDVRLFIQEARVIGLDDLPDFRRAAESQRALVLRNLLFSEHLPTVAEPSAAEVDRRLLDAVEEVRMRALFIEEEASAEAFAEALGAGRGFDELAGEAVARGEAKEGDSQGFTRASALHPEVRVALSTMQPGEVSPVIDIGAGWAVFRLLERRAPADPAEREKIREKVRSEERQVAIRTYVDGLRKRHSRIDRGLLTSLDFESKDPGLEGYVDDERVLAEVEGGAPVTVAEVAKAVRGKFFHGAERAAERGDLNAKAREALDDLLDRRVVVQEAVRLSLDESEEYRRLMDEFESQVLFGMFIQKVVEPNLELGEEELRAFFEERAEEYASPAMIRLESLAFRRPEDARATLVRLDAGTDPGWVRQNARGQVHPADDPAVLVFAGKPLLVSNLPEGIREAVDGASAGDHRLVEHSDGLSYVFLVVEVIPSSVPSFEQVRSRVATSARAHALQESVRDYASRLREVSEIEVYAEGDALSRVLLEDLGGRPD